METIRLTKSELQKILEERGLKILELSLNEILNNIYIETKDATKKFGNYTGNQLEPGFKVEDGANILINRKYAENVINAFVNTLKKIEKVKKQLVE